MADLKLRDEDGYYSREVEVEAAPGVHFKIRELDDRELKAFLNAEKALSDMVNIPLAQIKAEHEKDLAKYRESGEDGQEPTRGDTVSRLLGERGDTTPDQIADGVRLAMGALDAILGPGVVGWDISRRELKPGEGVLLPSRVKIQLSRSIMADSTLQADEARFLA
jgi:hypothetical protein